MTLAEPLSAVEMEIIETLPDALTANGLNKTAGYIRRLLAERAALLDRLATTEANAKNMQMAAEGYRERNATLLAVAEEAVGALLHISDETRSGEEAFRRLSAALRAAGLGEKETG